MGERLKNNMKASGRSNSNNIQNGYRNYANGPLWDHRRNEDYSRYPYFNSQRHDRRQGLSQRRDFASCFPAEYRQSNNSQDLWNNDIGGINGAPAYYDSVAKYNREQWSKNYPQHRQFYGSHPQYENVALESFSTIPQGNVNWQQHNRYPHGSKRRLESDDSVSYNHNFIESNHKAKKKKPLSQNVPAKREWTIDDAKKAINVEMEFSKRFKQNSLMIKFPDIDINKEIVSKFHSDIDNVHFQQPSTARYCFVTLNDHADGDLVIKALNTTKFGQGFLTAEYKKERDNQLVSPEDIDPLTLYVGNLAQEITKQDLEQIYTKKKRIDIGFAMKMKKTRYAFISFWNVEDSIEAYTRTRSDVLYSKSLIVRFRRLHGTVGLPGEPKFQNPPKNTNVPHTDQHNEDANSSGDERASANLITSQANRADDVEEDSRDVTYEENLIGSIGSNSSQSSQLNTQNDSKKENDNIVHLNHPNMEVDLSLVKQEEPDDTNQDKLMIAKSPDLKKETEADTDVKGSIAQFDSPFLPTYVINELMIQHMPIKEEISSCGTSVSHADELQRAKQADYEQRSQNDCYNSGNENFSEFEMDMVSSVDFNSIYKSIQPKPGS